MNFELFDFEPDYECDPMSEAATSGNLQTFYFTLPERTVLGSGLIIDVEPLNNEPWRGYFDWGDGRLNKVCACPQKNCLCVVAKGQCCIVDVLNPQQFIILSISPVEDVQAAAGCGVLILIDFASAYALGANGHLWYKTLVSDELKISSIENNRVYFTGWSAPENRYIQLNVNVFTGEPA